MLVRAFALALALVVPACGSDVKDERRAPPILLDLNRATLADLERLPGIGPRHARSILASRNARGGRFDSLEQLLEIDGIGPKTVAALRQYVAVER